MSRWRPMTERDEPVQDDGIDFVLTPQERTQAAIHACQIREMLDRQNERDRKGGEK